MKPTLVNTEAPRWIRDLRSHPRRYVTVRELSEYWCISRKQLYKQIDAGMLPATRFGPRLLRIRADDALSFEVRAKLQPLDEMSA